MSGFLSPPRPGYRSGLEEVEHGIAAAYGTLFHAYSNQLLLREEKIFFDELSR